MGVSNAWCVCPHISCWSCPWQFALCECNRWTFQWTLADLTWHSLAKFTAGRNPWNCLKIRTASCGRHLGALAIRDRKAENILRIQTIFQSKSKNFRGYFVPSANRDQWESLMIQNNSGPNHCIVFGTLHSVRAIGRTSRGSEEFFVFVEFRGEFCNP